MTREHGSAEIGKMKIFVQKSGATRTTRDMRINAEWNRAIQCNEPGLAKTTPSTNIPEQGFRETGGVFRKERPKTLPCTNIVM